MKLRGSFACIALLMIGVVASAQAPQMPKPAPEVKRLEYSARGHVDLELRGGYGWQADQAAVHC